MIIITKNGEPFDQIIPYEIEKNTVLDNLAGIVQDTGLVIDDIKTGRLARQ